MRRLDVIKMLNGQIQRLTDEEKRRFYNSINQQRFFDYFRTKKDLKSCCAMLKKRDITFSDAVKVLWYKMNAYIKSRV